MLLRIIVPYGRVWGPNSQTISAVKPSSPFEEAIVDVSHVVKAFCFNRDPLAIRGHGI
jgi:hypothetical protein